MMNTKAIRGRSPIQKVILPRNWLFGRLCYVSANLSSMLGRDYINFTEHELEELDNANDIIRKVISNKKAQATELKRLIIEKHETFSNMAY